MLIRSVYQNSLCNLRGDSWGKQHEGGQEKSSHTGKDGQVDRLKNEVNLESVEPIRSPCFGPVASSCQTYNAEYNLRKAAPRQ
jgi:hypothetical protein